ncbi:uncharacterized UDP-glucosyltransferase YdhE-like [Oppia nitens]|uniref:uncharacterized UDP-glucosyltransferase YdhE-like n=1 Tax=Oppia nitens TaxID=1686743 RepID=UPI0023DB97A8|nr:uncharacterized UDP-glucosyltransferase YdhE-like [Oppia nitens]
MVAKKLTVLFTPLNGWGHINACHGLASELKRRDHRVVFAIDEAFKGKLEPFGFEEEIHGDTQPTVTGADGGGSSGGTAEIQEYWPRFMAENCHYLLEDPIVIAEKFFLSAARKMFADSKDREAQYADIIERVKPDVIVSDNYVDIPAITNSGIPWIWLFSAAPHLAFLDSRIPPSWSGLPTNGDRKQWQQFTDKWIELFKDFQQEISDYCQSRGAPKLEDMRLHPISPYLNLYLYPKELDYEELYPMANNWKRVENFMRITNDTFSLPSQLASRPGKLVFLSMGSFGCANLSLMTRLTTILGKSRHRFIVSKGPLFESHDLPDNQWGQRFLPQTAILPLVDLVITHGGNNTVTETFYYGKPMLVLPLFGDQLDNAQRVEETGHGLRLNPFKCTDDELLSAVDRLVADDKLTARMQAIGDRIRSSPDISDVSNFVEDLCQTK